MSRTYVYHWTHRGNLESIMATGLDPAYSEGRLPRVWVCGHHRIAWAMTHVATRHGWDPDDLVCLRIDASCVERKPTHLHYVYTCRDVIPPSAIVGVLYGIMCAWVPPPSSTCTVPTSLLDMEGDDDD
jgi:RNA:NAD 2'-phosphotransferase (TPT1/KptA family)